MKKFKWLVEISVDEKWVADGFNITRDRLCDQLQEWLPYATSDEIKGRVIYRPDPKDIKEVQS